MMVIAPLSANTLAKVVAGMADNLVTSVVRAWDIAPFAIPDLSNGTATSGNRGGNEGEERDGEERLLIRRRIVVAPAMNSAMWTHPVTAKQIRVLEEEWGVKGKGEDGWFEVLWPQEKVLACGDIGQGGMCEVVDIVNVIEERLGLKS